MTAWEYVLCIERHRPHWPVERKLSGYRLIYLIASGEGTTCSRANYGLEWSKT